MSQVRPGFWPRGLFPILSGLLLMALPVCAVPQDDSADSTEPTGESAVEEREAARESADRILGDDIEASAGEGYTYDPAGRRDPFLSLLRGSEVLEDQQPDEGIPGLRIDEIDLTGIFVTGDGAVAQIFSTSQGKSYLLREGDQLRDGDVVSISSAEIVFKQDVPGVDELKPYREVVKKLNS